MGEKKRRKGSEQKAGVKDWETGRGRKEEEERRGRDMGWKSRMQKPHCYGKKVWNEIN